MYSLITTRPEVWATTGCRKNIQAIKSNLLLQFTVFMGMGLKVNIIPIIEQRTFSQGYSAPLRCFYL
jgi:hypothetical protein